MKRSSMVMLAGLIALFVAPYAMAWVYGETVVYSEPVVAYVPPPVVAYETTTIGVPWFSVSSTRSYYDAPVIERSYYDTAVIYDRPHFVARSYNIGRPFYGYPRHGYYFGPGYHYGRDVHYSRPWGGYRGDGHGRGDGGGRGDGHGRGYGGGRGH